MVGCWEVGWWASGLAGWWVGITKYVHHLSPLEWYWCGSRPSTANKPTYDGGGNHDWFSLTNNFLFLWFYITVVCSGIIKALHGRSTFSSCHKQWPQWSDKKCEESVVKLCHYDSLLQNCCHDVNRPLFIQQLAPQLKHYSETFSEKTHVNIESLTCGKRLVTPCCPVSLSRHQLWYCFHGTHRIQQQLLSYLNIAKQLPDNETWQTAAGCSHSHWTCLLLVNNYVV